MDHSRPVWCISVCEDASTIVSGSSDKTVRVWRFADGEKGAVLEHPAYVNAVALCKDGSVVFSGCGDTIVRMWDAWVGSVLRTLQGHSAEITSLRCSPDGTILLTGSNDGSVLGWCLRDRSAKKKAKIHEHIFIAPK